MTDWRVVQGDCRELLREVPAGSVSLFCTSPPYAQGKEYEVGLDYDGLWELIAGVAEAALPACKPSGFCFVNFGETTKYPKCMAQLYNDTFREAGWLMHSRRIWQKNFGACQFTALNTCNTIPIAEFEHLWTFRCPPAGKETVRDKASYKGVWGPFGGACETDHPCEFPVALPAQAVRVWTDPGDLVCDPFCGSGSTGVAAVQLGRRFLGMELSEEYCRMARDRIGQAQPPLFAEVPE